MSPEKIETFQIVILNEPKDQNDDGQVFGSWKPKIVGKGTCFAISGNRCIMKRGDDLLVSLTKFSAIQTDQLIGGIGPNLCCARQEEQTRHNQ